MQHQLGPSTYMSSHAYVYLHTHVQLVYTHRGGKPAQDDEQIPHQLILGSSPILPTACFIIQMYSSTTLDDGLLHWERSSP